MTAARRFPATLGLASALALLPAPAVAQAWQCRVPPSVNVPRLPRADGPRISTPVTGYVLALSWSPEFCHGRGNGSDSRLQCSGRIGRFGFILHGLWPEGRGRDPQWCAAAQGLTERTVRENLCVTPSPRLMAHEWAKHGACMARTPAGYLKAGRVLFHSMHFPDMARLSRKDGLSAGMVRAALVKETPFLSTDMIRLQVNARGWLEEVQVCYGRDFMPARCPGGTGPRDSQPVKIWRSFS
ncbi:ribonuclease T [Novosphingobium sp. ZN18A2]|uniref:ribonuclease T2 family protein n=1 Tax=Novosphingobium sp. ZN18A2 TaxID=3079861 RepID=UPI0030D1B263